MFVYIRLHYFTKPFLDLFVDFHSMLIGREQLEAKAALALMIRKVNLVYLCYVH